LFEFIRNSHTEELEVHAIKLRIRQAKNIYKPSTNKKERRPVLGANCPYCNFAFVKRPQRNRKCPNCQSKIILRDGNLLSEDQAEDYDRKKCELIGKQLDHLRRRNLTEQKELGGKYVEISSACDGASCQSCNQLNGKRFLLEDELRNPTLPVKDCTSEFCRCCYLPVIQ
jgi:predicted Zn-ribbon and HTH transcriptional regulator